MHLLTYRFLAALLLGSAYLFTPALAQEEEEELENLVRASELEEEDMQKIPGTNLRVPIQQETTGRVRLPAGEEVPRTRFSQDREIDPATYIVGPGDILQLYIFGEWNRDYQLEVNPEGRILVPTVGEFYLFGKTLNEAKTVLLEAAAVKYRKVDIAITLASMRFYTVYITGAVGKEGSHIIHPMTRLSDLIEKAGNFAAQTGPPSQRAIRITHKDGSEEIVDLQMFRATGDLDFNPYIRMGDAVHAPLREQTLFIYGAVNLEGEQEYRPGDTFGDIAALAGGLQTDAYLQKGEIWRFQEDGKTTDIIKMVDLAKPGQEVTFDDVRDVPVAAADMIFVRFRADWQLMPSVHVHGEVRYSGRYRIIEGVTTSQDLLEKAGGLTDNAWLTQAKLIRVKYRAIKDSELIRLQALQQTGGMDDMDPEERAYLKTKAREERGRVAMDFKRLIQEQDLTQDILLEGGDVIFIPRKRRTVSITGQVIKPGLVDYKEGRNVGFYLDWVGGYTWEADKGSSRLIRASTGLREPLKRKTVVEEGDEIWVPQEEYFDWWRFTQSTMRTVAEALTIIVVVRSI
jgi:protein involved in polysaccharide export with SLBB domain